MTEGILDLYVDVVSPFAYLAYQIIKDHEASLKVKVNYHPVSMAAIFRLTKNTGPALVPLKFQYLRNNLVQLSEFWDMDPVILPAWFEERAPTMSPILPLRVITYIQHNYPDEFDRTIRAFWSRMFNEHKTNFLPADVEALLEELGFDPEIVNLAQSEENRRVLRDNVTNAVRQGAFGVPYMMLKRPGRDSQAFFGVESLPLMFKELGLVKSEPVIHAKL
ncbi:unnamed protein product [Bursaphelenchus xylophilus]|uniref:Glutathione S-transferase kappa n=1 Tax=Bursaphelenchus xylophilus TaxID=6326 RepID=A0A1I7S2P3_BURXY|nr:unnamed protein product [Bursaphelenchus xylophilus]CAG9121767.1 unnamed protein product [Bursaphelenchus xylophilus]